MPHFRSGAIWCTTVPSVMATLKENEFSDPGIGGEKLVGLLCERRGPVKIKGMIFRTVVRRAMTYELKTAMMTKKQERQLDEADTRIRARNSWYFGSKCYHVFSFATGILVW